MSWENNLLMELSNHVEKGVKLKLATMSTFQYVYMKVFANVLTESFSGHQWRKCEFLYYLFIAIRVHIIGSQRQMGTSSPSSWLKLFITGGHIGVEPCQGTQDTGMIFDLHPLSKIHYLYGCSAIFMILHLHSLNSQRLVSPSLVP